MVTRQWDARDPFAGQELPLPPAWLPEADLAVFRGWQTEDAAAMTAAQVGAAPSEAAPSEEAQPQEAQPQEDQSEAPVEEPAPVPVTLAKPEASLPAPPRPSNPPPVDHLSNTDQPPSAELPESTPEAFTTTSDDEPSEIEAADQEWHYVPLGISDPEAMDDNALLPPDDAAAAVEYPVYPAQDPDLAEAQDPDAFVDYDETVNAPATDAQRPFLPGQLRLDEERARRWPLYAAAGAVLLVVVVLVVIVVGGGGKPSAQAKGAGSTSASPPGPIVLPSSPAGPVPADQQPTLRPQHVTVSVFDDELQVTWDPPATPNAVSGYQVAGQNRDGAVQSTVTVGSGHDLSVVFDDADLCAVVSTVVATPQGFQIARGDVACPDQPTDTASADDAAPDQDTSVAWPHPPATIPPAPTVRTATPPAMAQVGYRADLAGSTVR